MSPTNKRTGLRAKGYALATWVGLGAGLVSSCLVDEDAPCSEGMILNRDATLCVCPEDSVSTADGCLQCGEHEVATATSCECEEGFARTASGEACEDQEAGGGGGAGGAGNETMLGAECDPDAESSGCAAPYAHCEPDGGSGYCTSTDCTSNADCDGGYACNDTGVCERPPSGLGQSCTSNADCEGTQATFCDLFVTHTCLVEGCSVDPDDCFSGYECCDLSALGIGPVCVPEGGCML